MLFAGKGEALFDIITFLFRLIKLLLSQGVGATVIVTLLGLGLIAGLLWWMHRRSRLA
jgi:plastocyanin domain-containing protein